MINNIPPKTNPEDYTPIWIDVYFPFTDITTSIEYSIRDIDGNIYFSGKAYAYPDSVPVINISKICENYLENELPILTETAVTGTTYIEDAAKTFFLWSVNGALKFYKYYWNYNQNEVIYSGRISKPINGHYSLGMFKLDSSISESGLTVSWNKEFNDWNSYTTSACGDYVLYYLNRNGGWDSFLIEGKVIEKDTYKRNSFENKPSQEEYWKRETKTFKNQIEHSYELNTDWLTDEQSEILAYHLLSSNNVYLHNLKTNTIIPVNITDTSTEYKYFKNKRKLNSYTIKVVESNKQTIL